MNALKGIWNQPSATLGSGVIFVALGGLFADLVSQPFPLSTQVALAVLGVGVGLYVSRM